MLEINVLTGLVIWALVVGCIIGIVALMVVLLAQSTTHDGGPDTNETTNEQNPGAPW